MEQDPLENYKPPVKKVKIEDEEIAVKEELEDFDLVNENVDDKKSINVPAL